MPDPAVTVVVPAYNAGKVLAETLTSAARQTFKNFEVIVVDDGSTDNTAEIVRQLGRTDPRFLLLQQAHQGVSAARNLGIHRARGEYIAFLDHDDVWLPEKLARQLELFREEPKANFVFTNYYYWDGQKDLRLFFKDHRPLPNGCACKQLISANPYIPSIVMVRRALFDTGCRFTTDIGGSEDWDLWLQFMEHGLWAYGTREPLVRFRQWENNFSNRKMTMLEAIVKTIENRLRLCKLPDLKPAYEQSLAFARGRLELARARQWLDTEPRKVPASIWRAWRHHPRRLKWLMWYGLVAWPKILGGSATERIVHRKLEEKF